MTATPPAPNAIRLATAADNDNVVAALTTDFSADVIISRRPLRNFDPYASGYFACCTDFAIEPGYVWTTGETFGALITMPPQAWQRSKHDTELEHA